jgi:FMN reductase
MYVIISCSLNPSSRSRILARAALDRLVELEHPATFIDLAQLALPACDDARCFEDENVKRLKILIAEARAILLATPIYNFDASAAAKNVVELTGAAWRDKPVGFLCAAGGRSSYMAVLGLANSLMLDFHCLILPRFVYATEAAFRDDRLEDRTLHERLTRLVDELVRLAAAWSAADPKLAVER